MYGLCTLARALTHAGADVNAHDRDGVTALMNAAEAGDAGSVTLLLAKAADASAVAAQGYSALTVAAAGGHEAIARSLVAAGAAVDHMEGESVSPLMYAAAGGHLETVKVSVWSWCIGPKVACKNLSFRYES